MNQAKKMVLISPETLQRLNNAAPKDGSLERDMSQVLHDPDIEDRTKWSQYQQMLQRNQHFHDQMRQPVSIPIVEKPSMATVSQSFEQEILSLLPKTLKTKGELLCKRLYDNEVITWDSKGRVSINGNVLPESNIVDLVSDVVRRRKSGGPTGWRRFLEALRQINVPAEYIDNPHRTNTVPQRPASPRPIFPTLNVRRRSIATPSTFRHMRRGRRRSTTSSTWSTLNNNNN